MADLYDQLTAQTPEVGTPAYEKRIVEGTRRTLAPQYAQAMKQARQNAANRGLYNSPVGMQAEQGLQQEFAGNLFNAGQQASLRSADLAEENRRSAIARAFALRQQQDAYAQQNRMADREAEAGNQQLWGNLLGGAAGGAGGILGKLLFSRMNRGGQTEVPDYLQPDLAWMDQE